MALPLKTISAAVFVKEPRPGFVKTRLAGTLGAAPAAALYRSFVEDTLEWLSRVPGLRRFLYYSPPGAAEACARLVASSPDRFHLRPQPRGSLGRRLAVAFDEILGGSGSRAVVLGTDCPLLDSRLLQRALRSLDESDLVLGPARDGGYYLIGLRKRIPELFERIPWSTSRVLDATLRKAGSLGLSWSLLEPLGDVDRPEDIDELRSELIEAWRDAARGRRRDFPRRTFRHLSWLLPPTSSKKKT